MNIPRLVGGCCTLAVLFGLMLFGLSNLTGIRWIGTASVLVMIAAATVALAEAVAVIVVPPKPPQHRGDGS